MENLGACFCSVLSICRPARLNQKHMKGWFQLKRFADLFRVHYIITRNHSNTFLLINLQKTKFVQNKTLQQGLFVLISDF